MSWGPFRDDTISAAGIQTAGPVCWRLQINDQVVDSTLEDMEQMLSDQLEQVRSVMGALSRFPQQRRGA